MDEPRLFYMHFWAADESAKLVQGLRAALEQTNSQKYRSGGPPSPCPGVR